MTRIRHLAGTLFCCASAAALFASASAARGEPRVPMDHLYSPRFELIAHCRAEEVDGRLLYQVLDVWKGKYDPAAFTQQPPQGYINARGGARDRRPGEEVIFFYSRENQLKARFELPEITIRVVDGNALVYPPGFKEFHIYAPTRVVDLAKLKREIQSRIVAVERPTDLPGNWRMLMTGGFEHSGVVIEAAGENRYRISSCGRFSGIYELRDERLVAVEPKATAAEGFVWKMHSLSMLTLVEQSDKLEPDYRGAVLFRPLPTATQQTTVGQNTPNP